MEVSLLKEKIVPVLKKSGVRRAALFGSTVKKDKTPNDIDILVEFDRRISLLGFINLKRKLEEILNQKVDLVEYDTIKTALKSNILETQISLF